MLIDYALAGTRAGRGFKLRHPAAGQVVQAAGHPRRSLMGKPVSGLLLVCATFALCAVAATPGHAAITPARTRISFTSSNVTFLFDASLGGSIMSCPTAELTVTTDDTGTSMLGRLTLAGNAVTRTCTDSGFFGSGPWSCPGVSACSGNSIP